MRVEASPPHSNFKSTEEAKPLTECKYLAEEFFIICLIFFKFPSQESSRSSLRFYISFGDIFSFQVGLEGFSFLLLGF